MAPTPIPLALVVGSWLGYSETFIYDQVQHQRRFRAEVLARRWDPGRTRFPYERVHVLNRAQELAWTTGWGQPHARTLERTGCRLVHAHFGLNGAFALPMLRRRPLPLVVSFHGHDVGGLFPRHRRTLRYGRYQRLAPELFERAQLLLAASTELADRLRELGAPSDKIEVHYLGIDVSQFEFVERSERPPHVLMVGRMVEKKGMAFGLEAFARLRAEVPRARLTLIGDGPLASTLRASAHRLGLGDAVHFAGSRTPAEVRAALAEATILLTPSVEPASGDRESGTLVVKEGSATGLPVVASDHGGIPEIVDDGRTGFLVAERDVAGLAERLIALARDPDLSLRLGRAGRAKMEAAYDTHRQNERLESRLSSLLSSP